MKPRVLLLDIETFPDVVYTWGVYEQNAIAVQKHWQMISFSAKWYGEKRQITRAICDYGGYKAGGDDKALCAELWDLLNKADIVVAHNGEQFDIKKIKARFIAHGMKPPSPYRVVDTKKEVVRVAGFSSNKLDWLCQQLELGRKIEHEGWELWLKCMQGDKAAWARMKKYNAHDIVLLEKLYTTIAPWIQQPNCSEGMVCTNPTCGSTELQARGYARNKTRSYQRFQCRTCGTWCRKTISEKDKRGSLVGLSGGDWK